MATTDFPLPPDLPRPVDDGSADHLQGMLLPRVSLSSTMARRVELSNLTVSKGALLLPMTGKVGCPKDGT